MELKTKRDNSLSRSPPFRTTDKEGETEGCRLSSYVPCQVGQAVPWWWWWWSQRKTKSTPNDFVASCERWNLIIPFCSCCCCCCCQLPVPTFAESPFTLPTVSQFYQKRSWSFPCWLAGWLNNQSSVFVFGMRWCDRVYLLPNLDMRLAAAA